MYLFSVGISFLVKQEMDVDDIDFDDDFDEGIAAVKEEKAKAEEDISSKIRYKYQWFFSFNSFRSIAIEYSIKYINFFSFEGESFWDTSSADVSVDVQVDSSKLPLSTNEEGDQVIKMYWLDAYEDYYKQPGLSWLVKVSCYDLKTPNKYGLLTKVFTCYYAIPHIVTEIFFYQNFEVDIWCKHICVIHEIQKHSFQ